MESSRPAARSTAQTTTLSRLDLFGALTALICAVHCALVPLAATLVPLLGLALLDGEVVEGLLLLSAAGLAGTSLTAGFRRHRSWRPLLLLSGALLLMGVGHYGHRLDTAAWAVPPAALLATSGLLLAAAHVTNSWLDRRRRAVAVATASASAS